LGVEDHKTGRYVHVDVAVVVTDVTLGGQYGDVVVRQRDPFQTTWNDKENTNNNNNMSEVNNYFLTGSKQESM